MSLPVSWPIQDSRKNIGIPTQAATIKYGIRKAPAAKSILLILITVSRKKLYWWGHVFVKLSIQRLTNKFSNLRTCPINSTTYEQPTSGGRPLWWWMGSATFCV